MRAVGTHLRTRRGHSEKSQVRWLNALTAVFLLAGLLANFVAFAPATPVAAQQKDKTPPPYPVPQSVVAVGSFQTAVGCGQDFDKECDVTQLQPNSDGTWTGTFQIPAGSYTYRIVTRSDIDRSFGKDGDPEGDDISLDVPDGALGVFFSFNQWTGEIYAVPVNNQVELSTDLGQFPMQPDKDGGFFAIVDGQPNGSFGAQVILDGNPVGDIVTVNTGDSGRAVVKMDKDGNLSADSVEPATLTVTKTDADGNPLTGACFTVYDGNNVAGQGCDASDGEDGATRIEFPIGVGNGLKLQESRTPDNQERADSQDIDINPGDNQVTVTAGGGGGEVTPPEGETPTQTEAETPTEQVTPELGSMTLFTVDENGNPVPNVCYTVSNYGDVQCDEDGDGDMGLTDVPAGDYTAQQASVPDGYQLDPQQQSITVNGGEEATATFTSPSTQAQTYTVTVTVTDQDGNPVPGACFTVTDANGNQGGEQCDDDQNGDVQLTLPNGDYTLSMTTTPDGYQTTEDQSFTVADQDLELPVTVSAVETPTAEISTAGAINVTVTDSDGFAIIGACVQISGPNSGEVCDNGDGDANTEDGLIRIENLPDGDYTVTVSQLPQGFEPAQPVNVTISGGQEVDAALVSGVPPTEEPTATEAPTTGSLLIRKYDPNKESLAGACFTLTDTNGNAIDVCDNQSGDADDRDGRIRVDNLTPGDYTVTESQPPAGYAAAEPTTITVNAGETARVNFTNTLAEGTVSISTTDGTNAVGGACYDLSGIGQQCDDDGDGTVQFDAVPPGDYTITQSSVPQGYSPSDPVDQPVTVTAGETAQVQYVVSVAQASLLVSVVDENGAAVAGACITVNDGTPVCDNDGVADGNGDVGQILINGLAPGDATVTMSTTPEGYTDGGSTTVTLEAGQQSTVTFTLSVALGRIGLYTTSSDGGPLGGACYSLNGGDPVCDNGPQDGDPDDGVMRLTGLTPGDYTISQTTVPDGYQQAPDQTITVNPGARTRVEFVNEPALGTLTVSVTDDQGNPVPGACVTATDAAGNATQVCDNQDPDQDATDGVIAIPNLAPGDYTVIVTSVPEGYQVPDVGQSAAVPAGGQGSAALPIAIIPPTETPTEVPTETPTAVPTETPTEVPTATQTPTEVPTATETATEEPTVTETATEEPTATETETVTEAPTETETATEAPTEVATSTETATAEAAATETPVATGSIRINVTDADGNALVGACFTASSDAASAEVCDNDPSDQEPSEGIVEIGSLPVGRLRGP